MLPQPARTAQRVRERRRRHPKLRRGEHEASAELTAQNAPLPPPRLPPRYTSLGGQQPTPIGSVFGSDRPDQRRSLPAARLAYRGVGVHALERLATSTPQHSNWPTYPDAADQR